MPAKTNGEKWWWKHYRRVYWPVRSWYHTLADWLSTAYVAAMVILGAGALVYAFFVYPATH